MPGTINNARCHLVAKDAAGAIRFYEAAFGAVEQFRMTDPGDGRVGHAELAFGDTVIMLADEYPDFGALSADSIGGSPVTFYLATDDADAVVARAENAGGVLLRAAADQSYGERTAQILDPYGYRWMVTQKLEDVAPEEMQRRWDEDTGA